MNGMADTELALRLLAIDPIGLGGAMVRSSDPQLHAKATAFLQALFPRGAAFRKLPSHAGVDRIIGGLDIAASLSTGRSVIESGILAAADGGAVVITSAERLETGKAALVAMAMDDGVIHMQRDGIDREVPARFAVLALDEGREDDERVPPLLAERLAFHLVAEDFVAGAIEIIAGNSVEVTVPEALAASLCEAALALGIASPRAALFAVRACKALAVLDGKRVADEEHAAAAARLVLAPRATKFPLGADAEPAPEDSGDTPSDARRRPVFARQRQPARSYPRCRDAGAAAASAGAARSRYTVLHAPAAALPRRRQGCGAGGRWDHGQACRAARRACT